MHDSIEVSYIRIPLLRQLASSLLDQPMEAKALLILEVVTRALNSSHWKTTISSRYWSGFSNKFRRKASSIRGVVDHGRPPSFGPDRAGATATNFGHSGSLQRLTNNHITDQFVLRCCQIRCRLARSWQSMPLTKALPRDFCIPEFCFLSLRNSYRIQHGSILSVPTNIGLQKSRATNGKDEAAPHIWEHLCTHFTWQETKS